MKWKSTISLVVILTAFLIFLLSFQEKSDQPTETVVTQTTAEGSNIASLIQGELTGAKLMTELGCNACHAGIPDSLVIPSRAPDLAYAGERYNPAFLFHFLQEPYRVRHNIGHSRMPDFQLSAEESLAIALYLGEQRENGGPWPKYPNLASEKNILRGKADLQRGATLLDQFACKTCHKVNGQGEMLITELANVSHRLKPDWVQRYFVSPYVYNGHNEMPSFFYKFSADSSSFEAVVQRPEEDIKDIAAYLFSLNKTRKSELESSYDSFLRKNKNITAAIGEKIFAAQNCAGCHNGPKPNPAVAQTAPDLSLEGQRVQKSWLTSYLKAPSPIRPFGYHPGSGSRMPDFSLTDEEVQLISDYLHTGETTNRDIAQLSVFSTNKAEVLLREKLPCTGCHQLKGEGGKIGPSLNQVPQRLQSNYVYELIKNPHELIPGTVMPRIPMPERQLELITNYLLQNKEGTSDIVYASLIDQPPYFFGNASTEAGLYLKYCAACHGENGQGDGYNAINLPVPPTVHANAEYIATRADDTMYDGIYAGGYILNKSNRMPAYGYTLSNEEIRSLVKYIRALCDCEGPAWSLD